MAKVIVKTLKPGTGKKPASVTEKRVRDAEGKLKVVRTLDANSQTFGRDFEYVFQKNVAKARQDNKRVIGATDVAIGER